MLEPVVSSGHTAECAATPVNGHYLSPLSSQGIGAMTQFSDVLDIQAISARADARGHIELDDTLPDSPREDLAATAVAIFRDPMISTEDLVGAATRISAAYRQKKIGCFVPLYITTHCGSDCMMCGMRKSNMGLEREFATRSVIEQQLRHLYEVEHIRSVGILTGEFLDDYARKSSAFIVGWTLERALQMGFENVFINIGSMRADNIEVLKDMLAPEHVSRVGMVVNQETYNRDLYARFMGDDACHAIKADYDRRINSHDEWLGQGFTTNVLGVVVGLNKNLWEELAGCCAHAEYLAQRGSRAICISVPRLLPALSTPNRQIIDDDTYRRYIATLTYVMPQHGIIMTNRETPAFQESVLPMTAVFAPGSPEVAPYGRGELVANDEAKSQFVVPDHRWPRKILSRLQARTGFSFVGFEPPASDANAAAASRVRGLAS